MLKKNHCFHRVDSFIVHKLNSFWGEKPQPDIPKCEVATGDHHQV